MAAESVTIETGINHEKRLNGTRNSVRNVPTEKTGLPFKIFHFFREFSSGTNRRNVFHLLPNRNFLKFRLGEKAPLGKPEIPVGKSDGSRHFAWEASEYMGYVLR